jgi:hypothetical protein
MNIDSSTNRDGYVWMCSCGSNAQTLFRTLTSAKHQGEQHREREQCGGRLRAEAFRDVRGEWAKRELGV